MGKIVFLNKSGLDLGTGYRRISDTYNECGYKDTSPVGFWNTYYASWLYQYRFCMEYVMSQAVTQAANFFGQIKFKTSTLATSGLPTGIKGFMTGNGYFWAGECMGVQFFNDKFRAVGACLSEVYYRGNYCYYAFEAETEYVFRFTWTASTRTLLVELYNGLNTVLLGSSSITIAAGKTFSCDYMGCMNDRQGYAGDGQNTAKWTDMFPATDKTWTVMGLYADNNQPDAPKCGVAIII